ncbi:putative pentatricopeptide repeat-containing protein [Nymphaea thermarum]|nr:putative pentatricopeptide repeat-containing protein [Nymphaea thermarum]
MAEEYKRFATLLRSCAKLGLLAQGMQIHAMLLKLRNEFDLVMNNTLVDMYAKCRKPDLAQKLFDIMPERNVVSWTVLINGYLQQGRPCGSLSLFSDMSIAGVRPNEFTFSLNLKACASLGLPTHGMQIHDLCVKTGFEGYAVVSNALIDMYAKTGVLQDAVKVFKKMPTRNLISWNTMIAAYVHCGQEKNSFSAFREMQKEGEIPDEFTLSSLLKASGSLGSLERGLRIHASVITLGFSKSTILASALIDLYVKCRSLTEARSVFEASPQKNVVSWTAMLVGYAQEARTMEAMELFSRLRRSEIQIDNFVISSLVGSFADFALVELGKQFHGYTIKNLSGSDVSVINSIVDMYIKCGMIPEAEQLFNEMPEKSVISWTAMITGYGKHGDGKKAIDLFTEMEAQGTKPDEVTFLAVLSACGHAGLLEEGRMYFTKLTEQFGFQAKQEHYACMVDLLGRAGCLKEAKNLIHSMPVEPSCAVWQTLLGACRIHRDVDLGKEVGEILLMLDSRNPVNYVVLSNLYAEVGLWKECEIIREMMKRKGLKKEAGWSWIEIDKEVHFFYGGDDSHPLFKEIHEALAEVTGKIKEMGYIVGVRFSLHDVDAESKEENLKLHSEKLAIGLGIVLGFGGSVEVIRVFKNLRVCGDCHEFLKGVSRVLGREILAWILRLSPKAFLVDL